MKDSNISLLEGLRSLSLKIYPAVHIHDSKQGLAWASVENYSRLDTAR
jgi:hypothetical protein